MLNLLKKLWANRTVDRLVWTGVEFGAGWLAIHYGANAVAGISVGAAVLLVKEFAIAQLVKAGGR